MSRLRAPLWITSVVCLISLFVGVAGLAWMTVGFRALTAERARQIQVADAPRPLMPITVLDETGKTIALPSPPTSKKLTILNFFYSHCTTICSSQNWQNQQLQEWLIQHQWDDQVQIVSVSFDPMRDTPRQLNSYAAKVQANPALWQFLTLKTIADLPTLLRSYGIVVIPLPDQEFIHNAAFHVIDEQGHLVRIVTPEHYTDLLRFIQQKMAA